MSLLPTCPHSTVSRSHNGPLRFPIFSHWQKHLLLSHLMYDKSRVLMISSRVPQKSDPLLNLPIFFPVPCNLVFSTTPTSLPWCTFTKRTVPQGPCISHSLQAQDFSGYLLHPWFQSQIKHDFYRKPLPGHLVSNNTHLHPQSPYLSFFLLMTVFICFIPLSSYCYVSSRIGTVFFNTWNSTRTFFVK